MSSISSSPSFTAVCSAASSSSDCAPSTGTVQLETLKNSLLLAITALSKIDGESCKIDGRHRACSPETLEASAIKLAELATTLGDSQISIARFSKRSTGLANTVRICKEENGTTTFFIYGNQKSILGKGNFKKVKKCYRIELDRDLNSVEQLYTIQRVIRHKGEPEKNLKMIDKVEQSIRILDTILKDLDPTTTTHIGPKIEMGRYQSKHSDERLELFQAFMPKTIDDRSLTNRQKLKILIDVADGLIKIHQKGYVHGDVKAPNININAEGEGYLNDFDLIRLNLAPISKNKYFAWDEYAEIGTITYNTDVYGLVFCAVEVFIPNFFATMREFDERGIITNNTEPPLYGDKGLIRKYMTVEVLNNHIISCFKKRLKEFRFTDGKISDRFPSEFKILELFLREFLNSMKLVGEIQLLHTLDPDKKVEELFEQAQREIPLTTAETLKGEFEAILRSLENNQST